MCERIVELNIYYYYYYDCSSSSSPIKKWICRGKVMVLMNWLRLRYKEMQTDDDSALRSVHIMRVSKDSNMRRLIMMMTMIVVVFDDCTKVFANTGRHWVNLYNRYIIGIITLCNLTLVGIPQCTLVYSLSSSSLHDYTLHLWISNTFLPFFFVCTWCSQQTCAKVNYACNSAHKIIMIKI